MTAVAPVPNRTLSAARLRTKAFRRPGYLERSYVVLTLFLLLTRLPNEWFTEKATGTEANESSGATATVVFALLFSVAILQISANWHLVIRLFRAEPLLPMFLGLAGLSVLWTDDPGTTFRRVVAFGLTTLFAYYLVIRFPFYEIMRLAGTAMVFALTINSIWIFLLPQYGTVSDPAVQSVNRGAYTGVMAQKNSLGLVLVLSVVVWMLLARANKRFRVWYYSLAIIGAFLIVSSRSKTSLANLMLLMAMLVVYMSFRARKTLFGAVAITMLTAGTTAVLLVTSNLNLFVENFDRDVTLSGRVPLWGDVVREILEKPAGHGWSAYWNGWSSPAFDIWVIHNWLPPHAHNALFDIALQLGFLGAALFVLLFIRSTIRATRHIRFTSDALGMFPLIVLSLTMLTSITESGVVGRNAAWVLVVVAVLVVTQDSRSSLQARSALAEAEADPAQASAMLPWR